MLNTRTEVAVLVDLDASFAARQVALEKLRRVVALTKDHVEEVIGLGFAADAGLDGCDLVIRIMGVVADFPPPAGEPPAPLPQEFSDLADLAPVPVPPVAETPAQVVAQPPGDRADGGGDCGVAAPVETAVAGEPAAYGSPWTDAEDDALVAGVVAAMLGGLSLRPAALACVGLVPGRTQATVEQRVRNKLRGRIEALVAAAPVAAPEPAPAPVEGSMGDLPDTLAQHLADLPRKRCWTVQRDLDVLHFALLNWKVAEIATELKIPADEIQPRFTLLTQNGRWKRAEVKAALEAMAEGVAS